MDYSQQVQNLGKEIASEFVSGLKGLIPNAEESAIITRTANRLAYASTMSVGASPEMLAGIKIGVDMDIATLVNLGVAKQIDALTLARKSVENAVMKFVTLGLQVLVSAAV